MYFFNRSRIPALALAAALVFAVNFSAVAQKSGGGKAPAKSAPGAGVTLNVYSEPAGAEVFVNGKSACVAPCDIKALKPGTSYAIEFRKKGYKTRTIKKSWAEPGEYLFQAALEKAPEGDAHSAPAQPPADQSSVTLTIYSDPDDADVYIDLEKRCTTPCKIKDLKPGVEYSIDVRKSGYVRQVFKKNWEKGGQFTIQAALEKPGEETGSADSGRDSGSEEPVPNRAEPGFNLCENKEVSDLWSGEAAARRWILGWHSGAIAAITDGDLQSGAASGYGTWGETGEGATLDVQTALGEAARSAGGIPALSIDLSKVYALGRIIIARQYQEMSEGEGGLPVMSLAAFVSTDGKEWKPFGEAFQLPPSQKKEIKLPGKGIAARYLRINIYSLGLYKKGRKTQSQMGISEVECFPAELK